MFFDKVAEFKLEQYVDGTFDDVRESLKALYFRTKSTIAREKEINLEVVLLIGFLEDKNAAVNLGIGKREDLAKALGLTPNQYWKRAQASRVLIWFPEFIDLVKTGKTHISHLSLLADEEVFMKGLEEMVERRDPLKKAERVEAKKAQKEREKDKIPSTPKEEKDGDDGSWDLEALLSGLYPSVTKGRRERIPSHVKHKVFLRDGGLCCYIDEKGKRCGSRLTLQVDHIVPVCHGGCHSLENLRLLCREHNLIEARRLIGDEIMDRYQMY